MRPMKIWTQMLSPTFPPSVSSPQWPSQSRVSTGATLRHLSPPLRPPQLRFSEDYGLSLTSELRLSS